MSDDHGSLRVLEQVWPTVAGVVLTLAAGVQAVWNSHRTTRRRIANLETIAEHVVTQQELQACRDDVRQEDSSNLEKIYQEIKEHNLENARQHQDILTTIVNMQKHD